MADINQLLGEIEAEARREEFPVDHEVYARWGKDPLVPIPFAGEFSARVCSFGRDLGRDEVRHGQPQVGAAGRLVREGVLEAARESASPRDPLLEAALRYVFLSNTAPYKPPGNKAYPDRVKERFRPFVERLLVCHWQGDAVITLGTEAFQWFARYAEEDAAVFWKREDRYEAELPCTLRAEVDGTEVRRPVTVCPLPHPSPLNQRWLPLFPGLLRQRLDRWLKP